MHYSHHCIIYLVHFVILIQKFIKVMITKFSGSTLLVI